MEKNIIYGIRAVIEAIEGGRSIDKIMIQKNLQGQLFQELMNQIKSYDLTYQKVPPERINKITRNNHQGVVAYISPVEYQDFFTVFDEVSQKKETPFFLILDGITDVRNFGAIARTAECAGVDAIVIPEKGSVSVTPDAIKTSAGALFRVPVCREKKPYFVLRHLKNRDYTIAAASEKGAEDFRKVNYSGPVALIMGSEEKGISHQLLKIADHHISIPVVGDIGSLNVSVAAGILIYEVLRSRQ